MSLHLFSGITVTGLAILTLSSCTTLSRSVGSVRNELKSKMEGKPNEVANDEGSLSKLQGMTPTVSSPSQLYDEKDIIWAEDEEEGEIVDASMAELEKLWSSTPQDSWFESYSQAMKKARKDGKPVLLWFTDSKSNSAAQALSNEVFSTADFEQWADKKVVRLRVDSNIQEPDDRRLARKRAYIKDLKKRYKAMGSPVVLMLSPRGSVFGKYVGYKPGDPSFYFGRLKNSHRSAMVDYGAWRESLERKGYRVWHDYRGRKLFAKPRSFKNGVLHLSEPDGTRSKTTLNKLSAEDRAWVLQKNQQKRESRRR